MRQTNLSLPILRLISVRTEEFDTRVMNGLLETGYNVTRHGCRWQKHPPPPGFTLMQPAGTEPPAPVRLSIPSTP